MWLSGGVGVWLSVCTCVGVWEGVCVAVCVWGGWLSVWACVGVCEAVYVVVWGCGCTAVCVGMAVRCACEDLSEAVYECVQVWK